MEHAQNNAQKVSNRAIHAREIPEYEQVLASIQQEKWSEVVNLLKPYLERNPYNGDYWRYYGIANEKLGQYEEACLAYGKAVECGNNYLAETTYQLGRVLARLGRGDEALKWLDVSLHNSLRTLKVALWLCGLAFARPWPVMGAIYLLATLSILLNPALKKMEKSTLTASHESS